MLAIFQIGGEFPDGFLAVVNSFFILQMCIEPICEMLLADRGCGAVDILEKRVFAKYIQIKSEEVRRVNEFFSIVKIGKIILYGT